MGGSRTPIIEGPRPLHSDRRADHYTPNCEEPLSFSGALVAVLGHDLRLVLDAVCRSGFLVRRVPVLEQQPLDSRAQLGTHRLLDVRSVLASLRTISATTWAASIARF